MTETTHTTAPAAETAGIPSSDPRGALLAAVAVAGDTLAAVRPEQLEASTPCETMSVRELGRHLLTVLRRITEVGRDGGPFSVPDATELPGEARWQSAWDTATEECRAVWSEPGVLTRELTLPFGTFPGAAVAGVYASEFAVHAWDLAVATGRRPDWDEDCLRIALESMQRALTAERRGPGVPFAPIVEVPEDAPLIDRLVAWNGRKP